MYQLVNFSDHRSYRNGDINFYIKSYIDALENAEPTASIRNIVRFLKSGIPIYNFELLFTKNNKYEIREKKIFRMYGCFSISRCIKGDRKSCYGHNRIFRHTCMCKQLILTTQQNYNIFMQILYNYLRYTDKLLNVVFLLLPVKRDQEGKIELQKKVHICRFFRLLPPFFFFYFDFTQKKLFLRKMVGGVPPSVPPPPQCLRLCI